LGEAIPVLDGGACNVGIESTIVSVATDGQWQLLRPGMISEAEIVKVAGLPQRVNITSLEQKETQLTPKVPGQHALHYSPRTPLSLFKDRQALLAACNALQNTNKSCAALLIGAGAAPDCQVINLPSQPEKVAEQLYSALHALDAMKVSRLLVELPPASAEWMAVLDRLTRAGHQ
jgi:L-threonylcarbamoyladenylate synthase